MHVNLKNQLTFAEPLKNLHRKLTREILATVLLPHLFILTGNSCSLPTSSWFICSF